MAYVCFIVDAFSRMIVGWRVAANMRTDMVLDALEMARWSRGHRARRAAAPLRRRVAVHLGALHRTPRRDRRPPVDRHRRRQLRQRAGRDGERALQDRAASTDPARDRGATSTTSSSRPSAGCTGSTPNASTATSATCRPPSSKQRSTLRHDDQRGGWNPITRASIKPRAIHSCSSKVSFMQAGIGRITVLVLAVSP